MDIKVRPQPVTALADYATIPIAFEVTEVFDVTAAPHGDAPFVLATRPLITPYTKDYDAIDGEGPTQWAKRFDVSNWSFLAAYTGGEHVGGATVVYDTPGLDMLEGRFDLAVLWDIRVASAARRGGVGAALFRAAERWALAKGCRQIKVETQNINVVACRFYARQKCVLRAVRRGAYPGLPDEIQLLWYKDLIDDAIAG